MDAHVDALSDPEPAYELLSPTEQSRPLVLASPHSGNRYPADFLAAARLDPRALRKSEDCFVDEMFTDAAALGIPLLRALFPRAYLDVNREAYELDPDMFVDTLPPYVNTRSPRVAAGLGTIARVVANGEDIYRGKLRFAEAERRVSTFYHPYHTALKGLLERTRDRFGHAVLIDCHSMPSPGLGERDSRRADIVLGDCFGNACAPSVMDAADRFLRGLGYSVNRNSPYAGGFTTRHYGRPRQGLHALQIEISRDLYMDETTLERLPYLATLTRHMTEMVDTIAHLPPEPLRPR